MEWIDRTLFSRQATSRACKTRPREIAATAKHTRHTGIGYPRMITHRQPARQAGPCSSKHGGIDRYRHTILTEAMHRSGGRRRAASYGSMDDRHDGNSWKQRAVPAAAAAPVAARQRRGPASHKASSTGRAETVRGMLFGAINASICLPASVSFATIIFHHEAYGA